MSTIYKDINDYFINVTEFPNQEIHQIYLAKWGDLVVPTGLGIAIDLIRRHGDEVGKYGSLGQEHTQNLILSRSMQILVGMQDAVVAIGKKGYVRLLENLSHPDEDIGTFVALELASKELGQPDAIPYLEKTIKTAKRTGFQLAISIALGRHHKYTHYASMAKKYVIRDDVGYKNLVESSANAYKKLLTSGVYKKLKAEGEYVYNSQDEAVNGSIFALTYQTAMTLTLLNIASRGKIPKFLFADWIY